MSLSGADAEVLRYVLEQGVIYQPELRRRVRLPQTYAAATCSDDPQLNKDRKLLRQFRLVHTISRELPAVFASKLSAQCPSIASDLCLDLVSLTIQTFDSFKSTSLRIMNAMSVVGHLANVKSFSKSFSKKDGPEAKASSSIAIAASSSSSSSDYVISKETEKDMLVKLCLVRGAASLAERTCHLLQTMINRMSTPSVNDIVRTYVGLINDYPTDFGMIAKINE